MKTRIQGMEQMPAFLEGTGEVEFAIPAQAERHAWIGQTPEQVRDGRLRKESRDQAGAWGERSAGWRFATCAGSPVTRARR